MPRKPQDVTDAELAVLKVLWERESATAREIRTQLYPKGTSSDHGTIQSLLQRLERKGFISRDRSEFAHVFRPRVGRQAYAGQQLEALADKLTDGSLVPFVLHLVENRGIGAGERREIKKLLDQLK
jgi:predicted transcriptional regulator